MKKNLFILGIAALAFAACSNDEVVEVNQGEAISFRPLTNIATRATEKTAWATDDVLDVFAEYKVGSTDATKYFQAGFTKANGGNFSSEAKYYWPSMTGNKMTFSAFYGVAQNTTTAGSIASAFTPDADAVNQTDILFGRKEVTENPERPVVINFRHMLSQIDVKVMNSNASLKFSITGVRMGYVSTSGSSFACTTVTTGDGNLAQNTWTPAALTGTDAEKANSNKYDQTFSAFSVTGSIAATTITGFNTWMLIPQSQTKASAYVAAESGWASSAPKFNGTYLAIQMSIMNNDASGSTIVASQWCYWPITVNWTPGYKYTYTVDLAGGGYQPTDQNNSGTTFDPVLDTPIEISADCTIDAWDASNIAVPES